MTRLPNSLFRQLLHNFEAHRVEELRLSLESGFFGTWWDWARVPLNIPRVACRDMPDFTSVFQLMISFPMSLLAPQHQNNGEISRVNEHRSSPASAGAPGTGRQPFSENESNLVNKNSRGALSRGHQHSAVGRAPIPDSSDTPVSVS